MMRCAANPKINGVRVFDFRTTERSRSVIQEKSKTLTPLILIRQIISYLVFILGLISFTLTFCSKADAAEVSVAVAANFAGTIKTLQPQFEQQTGHNLTLHIGSTGKLYAQIINGAPFDVFLAADKKRPEKLELDGKTVAGSRFTYANGVLVLWAPKAVELSSTVEKLYAANKLTRLSITNPKLAPYGMAAKQFLLSTNRWYEYQDMVVQGNNISQTFQFVESGGVDAGFIALAQIASQQRSAATVWEIPAASYTPLEQQAVLLKRGGANPAAESFLQFLKTDEVKKQIKQAGYSLKVGGGKINTGFK